MAVNVKKIKGFLALYEEYKGIVHKSESARLEAEAQGLIPKEIPEIVEMQARCEALIKRGKVEYGVNPHYFGVFGRQLKRMAESM